jgi:hypothetical protein
MSLVLELERGGRKAGHVCDRSYRNGPGCPLIMRGTSEDVMTATVFGVLRRLRPSLWLRPLLNEAFRTKKFRSCSLAGLGFSFWAPVAPPASRACTEGFTEVDLLIRARDLAILIEAKYRSPIAARTTHDHRRDQVIRLLDVAFEMTRASHLFTRSPYVLVLGSSMDEPDLVRRYRDPTTVEEALDHRRRYADHRATARLLSRRVGYASWSDLAALIERQMLRANRTERPFMSDVVEYVQAKMATLHVTSAARRQMFLPVMNGQEAPQATDDEEAQGR